MAISSYILMSVVLTGICFSFCTSTCTGDVGLKSYSCTVIRSWYPTLEKMCSNYGRVCCVTCNTAGAVDTTEAPACLDTGFYGRNCQIMQTWYSSFEEFCVKSKKYCCDTCENKGEACEDFGFAGISCGRLLSLNQNNIRQFCLKFGTYCCKTCIS